MDIRAQYFEFVWWKRHYRLLVIAACVIALAIWNAAVTEPFDSIEAPEAPSDLTKWVLLDDPRDDVCTSDLVKAGTGGSLTIANISPEPDCHTELTVFAQGYAPTLDVTPGWTSGSDLISEDLDPRLVARLNVVVVGDEAVYTATMIAVDLDVATANDLFDKYRLGIEVSVAGSQRIDPSASAATTIGGKCAQASAVAADPAIYDGTLLNVMYVPDDKWGYGDDEVGWNCVRDDHREIVYIRQTHYVTILAHEIGHALGLDHTVVGNLLSGWPATNLMGCCFVDPAKWKLIDHLSVGQVYRANFHEASWLHTSGLRSSNSKTCLDGSTPGTSSVHWPCPRLQLDWP
jgi:hypothetical protein